MSPIRLIDSPLSWATGAFVVGIALGVTSASVWLLTAGLVGFIAYLHFHGPAQPKSEGRLFSGGAVLIVAWLVGFVVHGLIF